MSWQLVSAIVLLATLGTGMLWYERSRPPSQIVALVAVLAALAVAGRIVLAPIPNLVATTDIVIIAGYVLGPAPGFAVGALGGLVSNFWLGQGVWTPWQMVAWGMCGVVGGTLWKLTAGRIDRWTLAVVCALAGLLFGAWMNLETMVSFGGEMSLERYLALEARAIPFDIAHMTGNIVFALAAGPAMIAALTRFRERFQWRQAENGSGAPVRAGAGVTMIALAATLFALGGTGAPDRAEAAYPNKAALAATWLRSQQNSDGGFPSSPEGSSSVTMTTRAMFALAATGTNPLDVKTNATPYGFLVNNRSEIKDANDIALTILALKTVGQDPKDFKGRNLIEALRKRRGNGSFGNDVNVASFAVLAFRSAGATKDAQYSIKWLNSAQNENGGWGISSSAKPDADSTGTALMAVTGNKVRNRAIAYLKKVQVGSGGFTTVGGVANSQSTGLVVQGLIAAGRGMNTLRKNGKSPADYLIARQVDDGSVWYSRQSDQTRVWVTADATTALAGKPLPIAAPPREKDEDSSSGNTGGATPGAGSGSTSTPGGTYTPPAGSLSDTSPSFPSTNPGNGTNDDAAPNPSAGVDDPGVGDPSPTPSEIEPTDPSVPLVPVAPTDAVLTASERGPEPSPVVAVLIALVVGGGLCGGTVLLARRFNW